MTFDESLAEIQSALKQLENQDIESIGFVPTLEFGVLFPEAIDNMIENRKMIQSEHSNIIKCNSTSGENECITAACTHLYQYSNDLNTINLQNPTFSEKDIKLVLILIDCMQIALDELRGEFEKINGVTKIAER